MARVLSEGSGKGVDTAEAVKLAVSDAGTINLPAGVEASSCEITRDGQDLVLTTPDGEVLVVENYFSLPDAPVIVSDSGALLSPALVMSFIKPAAGDVQVAATATANDASPVGEVTEVTGAATVTHTDGTRETITAGTRIFEGDIVETDAKGAVNIKFADDSTFAVSENARLAIDDFSFNAADQSGTTGLSILRGVFMFTSGLIGRENPDAVTLETPVGSIGIRGTIIGGNIREGGESTISVIEGAIVIRNGTGEQILSQQFETVTLTSYNAPIINIGTLNAGQMTQTYGAVRPVSPSLFTSIDDTAKDTGMPPRQETPGQPEQQTAPQSNAQPNAGPEQAAPTPVTPLTDTPVFQTLTTGSNIENALGAHTHTQVPLPPAPPAPLVNTAPPAADLPPPPPAPVFDAGDRRAPSGVTFISGGAYAENNAVGAEVARVAMSDTTMKFPVRYELVNNTGPFTIDNEGRIFVTASGNYETDPHNYNFTVRVIRIDTGQSNETVMSISLTDVDEAPVFEPGAALIAVNEGEFVFLDPGMLKGADPENTALTYTVTSMTKGVIQVDRGGWVTLGVNDTFTQAELADGNHVRYLHQGDEPGGAGFTLTVTDASGLTSAAKTFDIDIAGQNDAPNLVHSDGGTVDENSTTILTSAMLKHSDPDNTTDQITYNITNLHRGMIEVDTGTGSPNWITTSQFTQADVDAGKVRFTQDGSEDTAASFNYYVTDGIDTSGIQTFSFTITNVNDAPVEIANTNAAADEGGHTLITSAQLEFRDEDHAANDLTYTINGYTNGTLQLDIGGGSWLALNSGDSFTQEQVNANLVRFMHDGSETLAGTFSYEVTDGIATPQTGMLQVDITPVNDAPASVTLDGTRTLDEGTYASGALISTITIDDAESAAMPGYTFTVERHNGTGWDTGGDSDKFHVVNNAGTWELRLRDGETLDAETLASMKLRVVMNDGPHVLASSELELTIGDVNEAATDFTANDNLDFGAGIDLLLQGGTQGAHIAVLRAIDVDVTPANHPDYRHYKVVDVVAQGGGGLGGLTRDDFEIVDITRDGKTEQVLKLKSTAAGDYSSLPGTFTVTIAIDADQDLDFDGPNDFEHTFNVLGAQNTMVLELVNGTNGFQIVNDARGGTNGALFGYNVAVGDFNGDGQRDILIGAPRANNPEPESAGGYYAFQNHADLITAAADGRVNLSLLTSGTLPGAFYELSTGVSDTNAYYGSHVAIIRNFVGGDNAMAVSRPNNGAVQIVDYTTPANNFQITGIPTSGGAYENIVLASVGDLNGDGFGDLLIAAPAANGSDGVVRIVSGNGGAGTDQIYSSQFLLVSEGGSFGSEIVGLGDFDGDGRNDFAIASPTFDTNGASPNTSQGSVTIYFGSNDFNTMNGTKFVIKGDVAIDQANLGKSLAAINDFNGDGLNDLAFRSNNHTINIVFGSAGLKGDPAIAINELNGAANVDFDGVTITHSGMLTADRLSAVSGAGDFNGDGFSDIVIDYARSLGSGMWDHTLYILYGSPAGTMMTAYDLDSLNAAQGFKIKMLTPTSSEALTLTSAGDFNNDGFDDLLIGNPGYDNPGGAVQQDGSVTMVYGHNYDGKAVETGASMEATSTNKAYVGDAGDNILYSMGQESISFRSGGGDDTLVLKDNTNINRFDAGAGRDTLKLFFSDGEVTGIPDQINLQGLRKHATGLEVIQFDDSSKNDHLELDIRDVLTLAQENGTNKLFILGGGSDVSSNGLILFNNGAAIGSMTSLGGTGLALVKDVDGTPGQDMREVGGVNYYVYSNLTTQTELLVDARLAGAALLAN